MRGYQSRESLLLWKIFGARLDGRTNSARTGDIDYNPTTDTIHPKLDTLRGLTWDEKLTLARWVDLGAPIQTNAAWGWLEDDLRSTLWVSPTLEQARLGPVNSVRVGAYDLESGLASGTLSVTFNVAIGGQPAGTNFANGLTPSNGGVLTVSLPTAVDLVASRAEMTVRIRDNAGHTTAIVRDYTSSSSEPPPPPPLPPPPPPPPPPPATANLSLAVIDSPDPVPVNGQLTYTLTVTNAGPSSATKVVLVDALPDGATLVSASAGQGNCVGTTTVTCNLGTIANGANAKVTIIVKPTVVRAINNTATVTGAESDPDSANNAAITTTTVTSGGGTQSFSLGVIIQGRGTVTSNPAGISCPGDCTENYPNSTNVTLTATPGRRYRFNGWAGTCTGTGACVVGVTTNRSVTATFVRTR